MHKYSQKNKPLHAQEGKFSNNFVTNFKKKQKNKEDRKNLTFFYENFMQRLDTKNSKLLTNGKKKATTSEKEKKQYFFGENRNRAV